MASSFLYAYSLWNYDDATMFYLIILCHMPSTQIHRVGGVEVRVDHRTFGEDGGPAVQILAELNGNTIELLRFDCFHKDPHYHYDPSGTDDKRSLNKNEVVDPIAWTLNRIGHDLTEMISRAGYPTIAARVDQDAIKSILPKVESYMRYEHNTQ